MANSSSTPSGARLLAVTRILMGVFFLFFAQYKLASPEFAHTGYAKYVGGYIQGSAVNFYKPFLQKTVEHAVASGYAVGVAELLIGLSLVLGLRVRFFSLVGALFMFNLVLCTWNAPGPGPGAIWATNSTTSRCCASSFCLSPTARARPGDWTAAASPPTASGTLTRSLKSGFQSVGAVLSRIIARIPSSGPMAIAGPAQRHPQLSPTAAMTRTERLVSRKPSATCMVSAVPT